MTEQDRRTLETARRLYERETEVIAPDIVWHVPGHNPVAGVYRGHDAYFNVMGARMQPLARWEFQLENIMVNGDYVMVTVRLRGERQGRTIDTAGGHLLRIDAAGQVAEGWGFTADQDALDAFFAA